MGKQEQAATKPKKQRKPKLPPEWPENRRFGYFGSRRMSDELMLEELRHGHTGVVAVDVETFTLADKTLLGIGIATSPHESFWFPMYPAPGPYTMELLQLLRNPKVVKLFHNGLKFDLLVLEMFDVDTTNVVDTMAMARLCGEELDLESLGHGLGYEMLSFPKMNGKDMRWLGEEFMVRKNALDCQATFAAYLDMQHRVHWPSLELDMKLIPVLLKVQRKGIRLDREVLQELDQFYAEKLVQSRATCDALGFNPGSWQQVGKKLREVGAMPRMRKSRKTGKYLVATDEEALLKIDHPVAKLTLEHRKLAKMHGTYVKPWLGWDRVYTHFHENTATGRLGSFEPNLQNIPNKEDRTPGRLHRKIFVPDGQHFTKADFSQQELRLLAMLSRDGAMLSIYEQGGDLHTETARLMGVDRLYAKNTNFCMIYGGGAKTIMETAGIRDIAKAEELVERWGRAFPQAFEYLRDNMQEGPKRGYVESAGGRRLYLTREKPEHEQAKEAANYPIQASGAEATKRAMLRCQHLDMRLQVHDELLFEGDVRAELDRLHLEDVVPGVKLPIESKLLERWE